MAEELPAPSPVVRATNLADQGDLAGAILAFEEAAELHPQEVRAWLGLAAVRHKRGEDPLAVDAFARAASLYVSQGQGLKAIAVYKQATRIAPMRDDLALELAAQYRHQGLAGEAVEQMLSALTARASRGEPLDCLSVIRTALELDDDNLVDRVRLAESFSARGRFDDAMEVFREIIERLDASAHSTVYESVARRMVVHGEAPLGVVIDLARIELGRQEFTSALALLKRAHQRDPSEPRVLTGVADAFEGLGQAQSAVVALRHLAEAYAQGGFVDENREALSRILELAPDDPWARRALDGVSSMPLETLVFEEHVQSSGEFERTLSADDAVEVEVAGRLSEEDSLVERYDSGLDALFAATNPADTSPAPIEEVATRDIVAVEDAEGIELLATRDILSVELSPEEAALLDLEAPLGDEEDLELLATRDILSVDLDPAEHEALSIEPSSDDP